MNSEEHYNYKDLPSYALNRASLLYKRRLYAEFLSRRIDIRPEQWHVLLIVRDRPGMIQSEIAASIDRDRTIVTRSLDALTRTGFLERLADRTDRRCYRVYLTELGTKTVADLLPVAQSVNHSMHKGLTGEQITVFRQVLNTIRNNLFDNINDFDE